MDDIPKIGITGLPGAGKTNTLLKVVKDLEELGYRVGGMVTEAIIKNGERVGFDVMNWKTKERRVFAHVDLDTSERVGKYKVDIKALEEVGVPAIEDAIMNDEIDIIIIDEVGKMEMLSEKFCKVVLAALDSDKPILVTLHKKSRSPLLQDIRRRDDIRILEVTPVNRNLLPYKIEKILKERLPSII
ncbi:MAG: nucleotide kinase [Thermoplasmata archaeon]|nr:MAG: nucleotide kinase [Thermoplasmata archaeon]RLF39118.1 MAG: nucleotide kinase [Thermoplasmata archaeon]